MKHLWNLMVDTYQYLTLKKSIKPKANEIVLLCPHGLGDTYFICSLLSAFKKKNPKMMITLVIKDGHLGITKLFKSTQTRVITGWVPRIHFMTLHRLIFGIPKLVAEGIYFGNPFFLNIGKHTNQFGKSNYTAASIFKGMLDLPQNTKLSKPKIPTESRSKIRAILKKYEFKQNKTIVIAPEANSIPELNSSFWDLLIDKFANLNYSVIIIGSGYKHMSAKNLFFNVSSIKETQDLLALLALSNTFISLRSGLCDITLAANIKKVIIYPDVKRGSSTFYKCYNLKNEINKQKLKEIIYSKDKQEKIVNEIITKINQ